MRGIVLVRAPAATTFTRLSAAGNVPFGSTLDLTRGRVLLDAAGTGGAQAAGASSGGAPATAFFGGVVKLSRLGPFVNVALAAGNFAVCGAPRAAQARRNIRVRRVWGSGKGKFRTLGRNGSAATRGTVWLTEDRCDGTLFSVRSGVISVFDRARGRTVLVRAYLARNRGV